MKVWSSESNAESTEQREQRHMPRMMTMPSREGDGQRQSLEDFLKDKSEEDRAYYGKVWDNQKAVPVGILFNRPNFEGK